MVVDLGHGLLLLGRPLLGMTVEELGLDAAVELGQLEGDQRVFLGWAQNWREKRTAATLRKQVSSNPHSPRRFRVDGVMRNIDWWYEAFGVKPVG